MTSLAQRVRQLGVPVEEISVGATPTARFSAKEAGITELRPGNYIYYDRMQVALGAATWDDCALTVLARVVTAHPPDRIILDCGSKTLTTDQARGRGNPAGYGVVLTALDAATPDDSLLIERLSEEHATVRVLPPRDPPRRGSPATSFGSCRTIRASCPTWWTRCGWWRATRCWTGSMSRRAVRLRSSL